MDLYEQLKQQVAAMEEDWRKGVGGNKAAQTRVRKSAQEIKETCQQMREKMLEVRDAGDANKS